MSNPRFSGPSKATPSTTCQKCLKKGHYSYECIASAQTRPYKARPSRTQQLLNPSLAPALTNNVPNDLMEKKGVADKLLAKREEERGRARSSSQSSVSTVSTNRSRSASPPPQKKRADARPRRVSRSPSPASSRERHRARADTTRRPRSRSASPARRAEHSGHRARSGGRPDRGATSRGGPAHADSRAPRRERSLSPFSKRLALTEAMNK